RARRLGQALVGPYHAPAVFIEDLLKRGAERIRGRERSVDIRLTQHCLAHGQSLITQRFVHSSSPKRLWSTANSCQRFARGSRAVALAIAEETEAGDRVRPEDAPCRRRPGARGG